MFARSRNLRRARAAAALAPSHPVDPAGELVGAEPIMLEGNEKRGVLLIHGFNDTPQSVADLAAALNARGWTVHAPLLPNHGRPFAMHDPGGDADAWINHARDAWIALRARVDQCVLMGQSMGGSIAVILAVEERAPDALVLVAPYLTMSPLVQAGAAIWPLARIVMPIVLSSPTGGLHDPAARARSLSSGQFTPRLVWQLLRVVHRARRALPRLGVPTLVVQSRHDYRIPNHAAESAYASIGARDKRLVWRDVGGHVLAADEGHEEVAALIAQWMEQKVARP